MIWLRAHLVIAVHEPHNMADVLLGARCDHLTPGPVHGSHDLPGAGGLIVLHALPAHHEGLALVIFLGGEDKVPGRDKSTTTVSSHLDWISDER